MIIALRLSVFYSFLKFFICCYTFIYYNYIILYFLSINIHFIHVCLFWFISPLISYLTFYESYIYICIIYLLLVFFLIHLCLLILIYFTSLLIFSISKICLSILIYSFFKNISKLDFLKIFVLYSFINKNNE